MKRNNIKEKGGGRNKRNASQLILFTIKEEKKRKKDMLRTRDIHRASRLKKKRKEREIEREVEGQPLRLNELMTRTIVYACTLAFQYDFLLESDG